MLACIFCNSCFVFYNAGNKSALSLVKQDMHKYVNIMVLLHCIRFREFIEVSSAFYSYVFFKVVIVCWSPCSVANNNIIT